MEFDDELDDEGPRSPLLPPADRLWRHPSELRGAHPAAVVRRWSNEPRLLTVAVLAGTVGALLATGASYLTAKAPRTRTVAVPAVERSAVPMTGTSLTGQLSGNLDVVAITQRLRPAIVRLSGSAHGRALDASGVMFRSDGYALTDSDVAHATGLIAVLSDGRHLGVHVIGVDPDSKVAVVKVNGYNLPIATLSTVATVNPGEPTIAMGSTTETNQVPLFGVGVVRAVGRSIGPLIGMIKTDAEPAPEAAGGPLVDANGVVIGITVIPPGATRSGIGWATPIDLAYAAATQLLTTGKVVHPWLGVSGNDLDPASAQATGLSGGALIEHVQSGSPADTGGLDAGDVITSIDGRPVSSMSGFMIALRTHHPGERVILHYLHGAQPVTAMVTLGALN